MKKILISAAFLGLAVLPALAAGPETVAKSDRSLWPDPIDSTVSYDRASRAEILVFIKALTELTAQDDAALKNTLSIKSVDRISVLRVRDRLLTRLQENYKNARNSCAAADIFCEPVTTQPGLIEASRDFSARLPEKYRPWLNNAEQFHRFYTRELVRLAALFPKVSSEIDTFSPMERSGFELPDRHFLLTFDDGPTNTGGSTDSLLPVLKRNGVHGMFFVLGERLKKRLQTDNADTLQKLYEGQCHALHGWVHESHQKSEQWQTSILNTQQLVKESFPNSYQPYFRPPYGQRRSDSSAFFQSNNLKVALWNIDSQDWNAKVSDREAAQRVLTLMLLWRSGVILFHDVHAKAVNAVPWLVNQAKNTGVIWEDCRQY